MTAFILVKTAICAACLGVFGYLYNRFVAESQAQPAGLDGYAALLVVAGELVILAVAAVAVWGSALAPIHTVALVAALHIPAGVPMILGSIDRYLARRRRDTARAAEIAREALDR